MVRIFSLRRQRWPAYFRLKHTQRTAHDYTVVARAQLAKLTGDLSKWTEASIRGFASKKLTEPISYHSESQRTALYHEFVSIFASARRPADVEWIKLRAEHEGVALDDLSQARYAVSRMFGASKADARTLEKELSAIVSSPSFTESSLWRLVHTFRWQDKHFSRIPTTFIRIFIDSRGPSYRPPSSLLAELVKLDATSGRAKRVVHELRDIPADAANADPFLTALRFLPTHSDNDKVGQDVLALMQDKQITTDTSLLNALITRATQEKAYPKALSFYRVLRTLHNGPRSIQPDSTTYFAMLRSIATLYKPQDPSHSRTQDGSVITPRIIYRDMISICFTSPMPSKRPSCSVSRRVGLLVQAIHAFLQHDDYPAAMVTIDQFAVLGAPATARTFKYIVQDVAQQLRTDRERTHSFWRPRFLAGLESTQKGKLLRAHNFRERVEYVLHWLSTTPDGKQYAVPTADMMIGTEAVPKDVQFAIEPIKHCLSEAFLADVHRRSGRAKLAEHHIKQLGEKALADAKAAMAPCPPPSDSDKSSQSYYLT